MSTALTNYEKVFAWYLFALDVVYLRDEETNARDKYLHISSYFTIIKMIKIDFENGKK